LAIHSRFKPLFDIYLDLSRLSKPPGLLFERAGNAPIKLACRRL
jgi:hypothetical protein